MAHIPHWIGSLGPHEGGVGEASRANHSSLFIAQILLRERLVVRQTALHFYQGNEESFSPIQVISTVAMEREGIKRFLQGIKVCVLLCLSMPRDYGEANGLSH